MDQEGDGGEPRAGSATWPLNVALPAATAVAGTRASSATPVTTVSSQRRAIEDPCISARVSTNCECVGPCVLANRHWIVLRMCAFTCRSETIPFTHAATPSEMRGSPMGKARIWRASVSRRGVDQWAGKLWSGERSPNFTRTLFRHRRWWRGEERHRVDVVARKRVALRVATRGEFDCVANADRCRTGSRAPPVERGIYRAAR